LGDDLALAARLVLGGVFLLSAATKLGRLAAFASEVKAFGAPVPAATARLLPVIELAMAVALMAGRDRGWPPMAAIALLALFTGAIVANLGRGRAVPCPCFGAGDEPISTATVARNGWLIALAVLGTGRAADGGGAGAAAVTGALAAVTLLVVRRTR
jgi:uncharacterized membrane protein YphA (DoxX/SURF4 family)